MAERTADPKPDLDQTMLVSLLETMMRIRAFESKVEELFLAGQIAGSVHLYIGEESVATGVCSVLRPDDYLTSTHRGHGHAIAKGARLDRMMAELFGRRTGYCKGKGGSMHIADFSVGMLGANGIVAGGLTIAVGAALSAKMRRSGQVVACFFGDGATSRGPFHEALNMAAVYRLPVLFVNENNQYASTTPASYGVSVENVADRAAGYGIPGVVVDGNDVLAVREASLAASERAQRGEGPTLLECKTYRWKGHYIGDPEQYREKEEVARWRERCPIRRFQTTLLKSGALSQTEIDGISRRLEEEVVASVRFAEESPYPDPDEALNDLFTNPLGVQR
ncbi:MAG: thiamine pyrophosphate-dependent dehydrogenase E1 component subunit alpha [Chloroflexota bacterium]